ncbi:hypothetical protein [Pseudescherichia sp.]|uniref:hypothetical protein n=1 Tax=Pseudescherichia sp. TaxID=2055881 RepID=UPI00289A0551|nr:hypothetical protein [Pseudescherichia sp.]
MSETLIPPKLPQMSADGVINQQDLTQGEGVLIVIEESPNARQGDYLTAYWNGMQIGLLYIADDPAAQFPWTLVIPASLAPDGNYQVWYSRLDEASNLIASPIVTAVVQRNDIGTLPAPDFPEADSSNTITDGDIADGSTLVHVPAYTGIAVGDRVWVYWVGANSSGITIPESVVTLTYTVTSTDLSSGFDVAVAAPYVTVIDVGSATAWYTVTPFAGTTAESSDSATVNIDMTGVTLPPPTFPEGNDGWIDAIEAADGTPVAIPAYDNISIGDTVTVHWQGYNDGTPVTGATWTTTYVITSGDLSSGFSVTVPSASILPIGIGTAQSWYEVAFISTQSGGVSSAASVNIDTVHSTLLPPPVFPEAAGDNTIDSTEYIDGTPMVIAYSGMSVGDGVNLYWQGYEADGTTLVPGTTWSDIYTVTPQDMTAGSFTTTIPATFITPIGTGKATGQYTVSFYAGGYAESSTAQVNIMTKSTTQLYLNAATGAPWRDNTSAPVVPVNTLTVSGPAGAGIAVSLSQNAYFNETGTSVWQSNLDENGSAILHVFSFAPGLISLSAYLTSNPGITATASMMFGDYLPGTGSLTGYAISTGAAANGRSQGHLYVRSHPSEDITTARISLNSGSATMEGYPFSVASIPLYDDGSCSVAVLDTVVETVNFTISLPEASGSAVSSDIVFISFPPVAIQTETDR